MQLFELSSLIGMGDKQKEGEHCIRGKIADFEINRRCLSCTRGLSQLRRSVPTAALIHGACFLNRRRVDTPQFWAAKMRIWKY